ncbi:MAG: hypothetical protein J7J71_05150 [Deltaproteobacteria bacterium]|nr:hypothetical protein [Candidatus Tharpella sp.]
MKKPTGVRFKVISGRKLSQYLLLALLPLVVIGGYSAILILSLLILSFLIYSLMCVTVSVSIKNYLQVVAEKNLEIGESIYA